MLKILDVEHKGNYKLELSFNNGEMGEINLENNLSGNLYTPLKKMNLFIQYGLINGTIEWVNGADFAPEFLYELMFQQKGKTHNIK